jgi:hypothetical protein
MKACLYYGHFFEMTAVLVKHINNVVVIFPPILQGEIEAYLYATTYFLTYINIYRHCVQPTKNIFCFARLDRS